MTFIIKVEYAKNRLPIFNLVKHRISMELWYNPSKILIPKNLKAAITKSKLKAVTNLKRQVKILTIFRMILSSDLSFNSYQMSSFLLILTILLKDLQFKIFRPSKVNSVRQKLDERQNLFLHSRI